MAPAIAAIVVTATTSGRRGLRELWSRIIRWRVGWIWYAVIAVTLIAGALIPLPSLLSGADGPTLAAYASYAGAGAWGLAPVIGYVLLVNGFGEEIGWRGFLAEGLLPRFGRLGTSLIVAAVWAGWHLPLFCVVGNFRALGLGGSVGWVIGLTAGSVFLTWMYTGARHSILIVALWHTAFNLSTATDAAKGVSAAATSTVVMIAAGVIVLVWWRQRRPSLSSQRSDAAKQQAHVTRDATAMVSLRGRHGVGSIAGFHQRIHERGSGHRRSREVDVASTTRSDDRGVEQFPEGRIRALDGFLGRRLR
jgi:membrane protease YdiL (CAAX protease family)